MSYTTMSQRLKREFKQDGVVPFPYDPNGRTAHNASAMQDALNPYYPSTPPFNSTCPLNQIYRTLPPYNPPTAESGGPTYWTQEPASPISMKSIYTGVPGYYPMMQNIHPIDTMYGHDYSMFHKFGSGEGKRMSYHMKMYPLTDRNVREFRQYAPDIIPAPDMIQAMKQPVMTHTTLNSPLQVLPQAYMP